MGKDVATLQCASVHELRQALETFLKELRNAREEKAAALEGLDAPKERKANADMQHRLGKIHAVLSRFAGRYPGDARIKESLTVVDALRRTPFLDMDDVDGLIARLDLAAQPATPTMTTRLPEHQRRDDLSKSREVVALENKLRGEITTLALELRKATTLDELRKKFPGYEVWNRLSEQEQEELLLNEKLLPKAVARDLVKRQYSIVSDDALKYHRRKLRAAFP